LRKLNVFLLAGFVPATQQQNHGFSVLREVHPVAGPKVHSKLAHAAANGFDDAGAQSRTVILDRC
jgi:hypothetical protein